MSSLAGIKVVSWDVDGTLYPMKRVERAVIRDALRGTFSVHAFRNLRELSELGRFRREMANIRKAGGELGRVPERRDSILAAEGRWYGPAIGRVGLRPGVREAITWLHARGYRQVVVSDYQSAYKLERLGLADAFDAVYAGELLGGLKPSPKVFQAVVEKEGIEANQLFHIGDREATDGIAARAAGCRVHILGDEIAAVSTLLDQFMASN